MRTGWEIIVFGCSFEVAEVAEFFRHSRIQPCRISVREEKFLLGTRQAQVIEFTDWHEGAYTLDLIAEALDYLRSNQDEFEKLFQLPGIGKRYLNLIGNNQPEIFEFAVSDISLLAALEFAVSIGVIPPEMAISARPSTT